VASGRLDGWDLEGRDGDGAHAGCVGVGVRVVEEIDHHLGCASRVADGVVADAGDVDDVCVGEASGCDSGLAGSGDEIEGPAEQKHRNGALRYFVSLWAGFPDIPDIAVAIRLHYLRG